MRVDFSPSGALLTVLDGVLRVGDRVHVESGVRDARWRSDGTIIWVDSFGVVRGDIEAIFKLPFQVDVATMSSDRVLVTSALEMSIHKIGGVEMWRFKRWNHALTLEESVTSHAISGDGRYVAIGYENAAYTTLQSSRKQGRGFLVIDTRTDKLVDRSWWAASREKLTMPMALDAKGKRIALAQPEVQPALGAIRIDRGERYARTHPGGARAVALDDRGILAAYAYPKGERRLRIDYLAPGATGPQEIEIVETLSIEPDCGDIFALAFDRKSRNIACLDATGRVDVVPVP